MRLLRVVPINEDGNTSEPVNFVCYHPFAEQRLKRGEFAEPNCCAVDYEYESVLEPIILALGWQGGTLEQVIEEIRCLKNLK